MRVLVVNTGSSSLKLQVHDVGPGTDLGDRPVAQGGAPAPPMLERHVEGWDGHDTQPIAALLDRAGRADAVGHRVVHGGEHHEPAVIDDDLLRHLGDLTALAPLHQGRALAGILAARAVVPEAPQVACFDTMYHATLPVAAVTYALPAEWRRRWHLRRYGFHGLSHAYAARRAAELHAGAGRRGGAGGRGSAGTRVPAKRRAEAHEAAGLTPSGPRDGRLRVVTCHLGAGASLCASLDGRAVDTTMGFTPLEGLVMATRSGSVDPGLVLWLLTDGGLTPDAVRRGLERSSGLVGLAGTADMRQVLDRRRAGDQQADLAFDVYVQALLRHVGAMTASLGGLDVLAFTGGVGEHGPEIRAATADRLAYLGVVLDAERNEAAVGEGDHDVTAAGAPVAALVVEAREDLEIARQTEATLAR